MRRDHRDRYGESATNRCERALVTLIGDVGPWRQRLVLVGGLAPRYIVGSLPPGASPHVGTTDVDLVVQLAVDEEFETYRKLAANLRRSGFELIQPSYRWSRNVDGVPVYVEFLCETDQVGAGMIHRTRQDTGSGFGAFNVIGAQLVARDYSEYEIEAERLDGGGLSRVCLRVAGVLSYIVLKTLAFQDRHREKDAYDLIFTLANYPDRGPHTAGREAARSPVRQEPQVIAALRLLGGRFKNTERDGPRSYANFQADPDDTDGKARLRNEAVAVVRQFLIAADPPATNPSRRGTSIHEE